MAADKPTHQKRNELILKGKRIREDANGLICLNDIYEAAKRPKYKSPFQWRRSGRAPELIAALITKTREKSPSTAKISVSSVYYAKEGASGGTYAHPVLAAAYAAYLSPKLAIEIKEVWLRYRAGDPTLADEILERASDEGNRWVVARATGRLARRQFTDALKGAAVSPRGYGLCTHSIYWHLFAKSAAQLKKERGVQATRDGMDIIELGQLTLSEGLAAERIVDENCRGDNECAEASGESAGFVREAVERERASRRKRRLV